MAEIIKLKKEYTLSGKKVLEITLDFDSLSGFDVIEAEKAYKKRNTASTMKEMEDGWYLTIAEMASGIKYGDLLKLNIRDYVQLLTKIKNFLLVSDSDEITGKSGTEETEVQEEETETEE